MRRLKKWLITTLMMVLINCANTEGLQKCSHRLNEIEPHPEYVKITVADPIEPSDAKIPIYTPPKTWLAWVPARIDKQTGILIGGHWIYFKLDEGRWFIEKNSIDGLKAGEPADAIIKHAKDELKHIEKIIVPHR
jgi:hypothetical protein